MVKKPDLKAPKKMPEWAIWCFGIGVTFVLILGASFAIKEYKLKRTREEYKIQSAFPDDFFPEYQDETQKTNAAATSSDYNSAFMNPFSEQELAEAEEAETRRLEQEASTKAATQTQTKIVYIEKQPEKKPSDYFKLQKQAQPPINRRAFGETKVSLNGIDNLDDPKTLETWKGVDKEYASTPISMERVITVDKRFQAILIEEINSELPGKVTAVIEENVYGGHGRKVLIPAGTKVIGNYDPLKRIGEERLEIFWSRLITPQGINIMVDSEMTDQMGRSGVTGEVDKRYFERYGIALLVSMINSAALYQLPVDNQNQAVVVNNFSGELSSLSNTILKEHINIKPRVTIKAGARILISPTADIWFNYLDRNNAQIAVYKGGQP